MTTTCARRALFLTLLGPVAAFAAPTPAVVAPQGTKPLSDVHDLSPGSPCPDPGPSGSATIAKAAAARIPLKAGLTLSHTWKAQAGDYEHECLNQIASIDSRSIVVTGSCPIGPKHEISHWTRRVCWTDMAQSYLYLTGGDRSYPQTFGGALQFNLSQASFASLKSSGEFRHRYIGLYGEDPRFVDTDIDGVEKSEGAGTFKVIVNDRMVEVPTVETVSFRQKDGDIIRLKILDDPGFPLVLDYYIPTDNKFFITYTKVSFPAVDELEHHLAVDKHTDVYGIYFDFARSTLRSESEPVLQEIAAALKAHPDWKLTINGHTDNIGVAADNLELSRQRAQTVRKALIDRYRVDPTRLATNGFGASQPKESNDTDRGRARNRRVELVRQ